MTHERIFAGIDSGGSRLRAMLTDASGNTLGEISEDAHLRGDTGTVAHAGAIASILEKALSSANLAGALPDTLCIGAAGVGREPERRALTAAVEEIELAREVIVTTDAVIALEDAFGSGGGIVLIAGTGSIAFGRGPAGEEARCGGWGPHIGDEGSGVWIGRRALGVVAAASDGREPPTSLTDAILNATHCTEPPQLIAWTAAASPASLAALAPIVLAVASGGDRRAESLVSLAAEELALHVRAVARSLFDAGEDGIPVALGGGLMSPTSPLRKRLEQRVASLVPRARIKADPLVPVRGAARLAARTAY